MKHISKKMVVLAFCLYSVSAFAATSKIQKVEDSIEVATNNSAYQTRVMLNRLDVINHMDKSNLSANEKRVLRKEVKEIKKNMNHNGGGVYISVGALLIVILLLILLL